MFEDVEVVNQMKELITEVGQGILFFLLLQLLLNVQYVFSENVKCSYK